MADQPISGLTEKTTPLVDDDLIVLVDSEVEPNTTKFIKKSNALGAITVSVIKSTAGTINAGEVVYLVGYDFGSDSSTVELASNTSDSTMPAYGMALQEITDSVEGSIAIFGRIKNVDTSSFNVGDELFVGATPGTVTTVKPAGAALVQKVGLVVVADLSIGVVEFFSSGRVNSLPNLAEDKIWLGDNSSFPAEVDFNTQVSSNTDVSANTAKVSADGSVTTHSDVTSAGSGAIITASERSDISSNNSKVSADGSVTTHSDITDAGSGSIITGAERSAISANTAKVSADGSVTTHSDVTSAGSGSIITAAERTLLNSFGSHLQYQNSSIQVNGTTAYQDMLFQTDRNSIPNSLFTKVNNTDFRTDFAGYVKITYSILPFAGDNDRGMDARVVKNGSAIVESEMPGVYAGKNDSNRKASTEKSFVVSCAVNDVFKLQFASPEGSDMTIDPNRALFRIEFFK